MAAKAQTTIQTGLAPYFTKHAKDTTRKTTPETRMST